VTTEQSTYGYVAMFRTRRYELHATSAYDAWLAAVQHFQPPKRQRHLVSVTLVEIDGQPVTTTIT
jgi:hypothetical protein